MTMDDLPEPNAVLCIGAEGETGDFKCLTPSALAPPGAGLFLVGPLGTPPGGLSSVGIVRSLARVVALAGHKRAKKIGVAYRAAYDDKLQALRPQPVHDWTSHAADSFRYLALTLDRKTTQTGFYRRIEYSQLGVV